MDIYTNLPAEKRKVKLHHSLILAVTMRCTDSIAKVMLISKVYIGVFHSRT
jgi:hypothetical protein